jgi:hypothetical protein
VPPVKPPGPGQSGERAGSGRHLETAFDQVLIVTNDIVPTPNISALARELGVSRATVRRRLANGWQPPVTIDGEIVQSNQEGATHGQGVDATLDAALPVVTTPTMAVATPAVHSWPPYGRAPGLRWRAIGRGATGLALAGCGIAVAVTSIRANAWFGRSLTTDPLAGEIFSSLSVLAEIAACIIPTANRFYWQDGDRWTALRGFVLMVVALTVVFFAASGFVLNTISTGIETRGDRMTPAVDLAQRTADTLAKSRADECRRRGDRCRDLEAQERKALADLTAVRAEIRSHADPQAEALHIDSNTVRTVQAAAMVGMCLCAGYLISFGAGLIWPRTSHEIRA